MLSKSKIKRFFCVLFVFLLIGTTFGVVYISLKFINIKRIELEYRGEGNEIATNKNFIACATKDGIVIQNYQGKEISRFQPSLSGLDYPDQIALGEEAYYLLYRNETLERQDSYAMIAQVSYESEVIKKVYYKQIETIGCKDGILFVRDSKHTEEPSFGVLGIYANSYVEEKRFGEKLLELKADKNGKCQVGNLILYQYGQNSFSTQPISDKYLGGETTISDHTYIDEIRKEKEGISQFFEYQEGKEMYGICNILDDEYEPPIQGASMDKISHCYFYKIDLENNEVDIIFESENSYGILCTSNYVVYYCDGYLYKKDKNGGLKSWDMKQSDKITIDLIGAIVRVVSRENNQDEEVLWMWDQKDFCELSSCK